MGFPFAPNARMERIATVDERRDVRQDGLQHVPIYSEGPFRKSYVRPMARGKIGVGILCFYDTPRLHRALTAYLAHAKPEYELLVFDNSENAENAKWMLAHHPKVRFIRSKKNTGCWNARNRMLEYFASRGCEWMLAQDQDVVWVGDAAAAMADVFRQHKGTGCVTWKVAVETMGNHVWDKTGKVSPPESPGMCCMFSIPALLAGNDPNLIGWYHGYGLCYRGDSDVCFSLWSKGYVTRVVLSGSCLVRHEHPHKGTLKLGKRLGIEQQFSQAVFNQRSAKYRWPTL